MAHLCPCGGTFESYGAAHLDNDGSAQQSTRCGRCGVESVDYWGWQDAVLGDVIPANVVNESLHPGPDGEDVFVVATAGPDPRLPALPTFRGLETRAPYLRADEGGPFEPDSEEDDLAPASHFYTLGIPARHH
ncbi:hypothetical protein [Parafrankia sp. FMc2]|uniref:hypothetical protein n=1 Tax=Parafrankia sp. FMc2 TaxID=3233196 RepID=UPI0034D6BF71